MAEYTIELRTLIKNGYPLALDSYPIFDEDYRKDLNQKIIDHFYFREIGLETPDRFNFYLRRKMNEIMPYYNQMYMSEKIKFNPLATEYMKTIGATDVDKAIDNLRHSSNYVDRAFERALSQNIDTIGHSDRNTNNQGSEDGDFSEHESSTKDRNLTRDTHSHDTRTDNLHEGDKEEESTNELVTTDMHLKKHSTEDTTGNTKEVLDENTTSTGNKNSTGKETYKETSTEDVSTEQTVTNDLHQHTVTKNDSNGSNSGTDFKDSIFSDLPQSGFRLSRTTKPDGSIGTWPGTYEIDGYATTDQVETGSHSGTNENHENGTADQDNTGTVKTDGTSDTDGTKDYTKDNTFNEDTTGSGTKKNNNTVDTTGNKVGDSTEDTTGTVNTDGKRSFTRNVDNTGTQDNDHIEGVTEHETEGTDRNETGTHHEDTTFAEKEGVATTGNSKTDEQHSENESRKATGVSTDKTSELTKHNFETVASGRKSWSPSQLLNDFRSTFLNIDMMVIEELDTLFMGVF